MIVSVSVLVGAFPPPPLELAWIDCGLLAVAETLKLIWKVALAPAARAGLPVDVQLNVAATAPQFQPADGTTLCGMIAAASEILKVTVTTLVVGPAPLTAVPFWSVKVALLPVSPCVKVCSGLPVSVLLRLRIGG